MRSSKQKKQIKPGAAPAPGYSAHVLEQDIEQLPSFDGSNSYLLLLLFDTAPAVGERYYFQPNSQIDGKVITGVRVHYYDVTYIAPAIDMNSPYEFNGTPYKVIPLADYRNVLLTLADKRSSLRIQRLPAASLRVLPQNPGTIAFATPKPVKAFRMSISTMRCFIEFTAVPGVPAPFVVPISLYYESSE